METQKEENHAESNAIAHAKTISNIVYAYNNFDKLKEAIAVLDGDGASETEKQEAQELLDEIDDSEILDILRDASHEADISERAQEAPLSIEVRSDWALVGEALAPTEFRILLSTGGPACQIRGELNEHKEAYRAWLEYQDWGTPWTQLFGEIDQETLVAFANLVAYFGE